MGKKTITLDYPHISSQPAYIAEYNKLLRFTSQLAQAEESLLALEQEYARRAERAAHKSPERMIDAAERIVAGEAPKQTDDEQIAEKKREIDILTRAVAAQRSVVTDVTRELSIQAGKRHAAQHKEIVRRMMDALQALYDANREEGELRYSLMLLGYTGSTVPAMAYQAAHDPADSNGNHAFYWMRDARDYVKTDEERQAEQRKGRLAKLVAA